MPVNRIFHLNIVCTDLQRSKAFYELVGFKTVLDTMARFESDWRAKLGLS